VRPVEKRVALITGASSGIGKACAEMLVNMGIKVYGTSRKAQFPPDADSNPTILQMDVNENKSISRAVSYILEKEGKIDILINNAGFGVAGPVEETPLEAAKEQFETNFFGVFRLILAVLPHMRERREGLIVNISSIGGIIPLPFQPFYSASKFAVEGLTEALRMELIPFNVKVVLIEPGDLKTDFTNRRVKFIKENSEYMPYFERTIKVVEHDERHGGSPEEVARVLKKIINSKNPKPRYTAGPSYEKAAVFLRRILPGRIFTWALAKYYRII
jgi:short-subunit dehydrogenase